MRFVLTPVGSSGDVHPFVGIGRALRARGHDVVMVTGGPFEDVARRAGLGFQGMFSTEEYEAATNHPDLWHPRRGLQIVMRLVASRLEFAYTRLKEVYEPGRTVLVGHALSFVTRLLYIAKALKANSKAWEFFASWRPPTDVTSSFGFTQLNDWKRAKGAFANRSHCWRPEKSLA